MQISQTSLFGIPPAITLPSQQNGGCSKIQGLSWLKDKVVNKLEGWKGNLLNAAGKEVLIKAVIQAIPSYIMVILQLPKTFCNARTSYVARFWWQFSGNSRGIHWRKFEELCFPKNLGGLGFKDFAKLNTALLPKQAWRLIHNPNSVWAETLKAIYFPRGQFWNAGYIRN